MPEESQDHIIRSQMARIRIPFLESDWELFVREYMHLPSDQVDLLIATSFSTLELDPLPGDWELFEQMLPLETPVISMVQGVHQSSISFEEAGTTGEPEFPDGIVKEKLLEAELPFEQTDWEAMAQKLDGNVFDQAIRNSLEHYQIPVAAGDWQELATSLDAPMYASFKEHLGTLEVSFRRADWRVFSRQWLGYSPWYLKWRPYAAAAVALLLISLGVSQYVPFWSSSPGAAPVASTVQRPHTPDRNALALMNDGTVGGTLPQTAPVVPPEIADPQLKMGSTDAFQNDPRMEIKTGMPSSPAVEIPIREAMIVPIPVTSTDNIQKIKQRPLHWQAIGFPRQAPAWAQWLMPKRHLHSLSIGAYGAFGNTRAELSARKGNPGYTAGIRVELGLSEELAIVSGLQYENRGFSHRFFSFTPGQTTVENRITAEFHLAEIPVLLRYYLPAAPRVRVYGQTGVIAMISLQEDYQLFQNSASNIPVPGISGSNLRLANPASEQRRSLETYIGNIFGGVGISVEATNRLHVQIEPYMLLSLQNTKGSGALGVEKRMYHAGIGASLLYRLK